MRGGGVEVGDWKEGRRGWVEKITAALSYIFYVYKEEGGTSAALLLNLHTAAALYVLYFSY